VLAFKNGNLIRLLKERGQAIIKSKNNKLIEVEHKI